MEEELTLGDLKYQLILLPKYKKELKNHKKIEPRLHEAVLESLKNDLEGDQFDEIPGCGGWIKGRVASPSRNIGKSGGFRVIYMYFEIQNDIYIDSIYDHRKKSDLTFDEKKDLFVAAQGLKKLYLENLSGDAK